MRKFVSFAVVCSAPIVSLAYASSARAQVHEIAVYHGGNWSIDSSGDHVWQPPPSLDTRYVFGGSSGDVPVILSPVGVVPFIAVFNAGVWSADTNLNGQWDGTGSGRDTQYTFGQAGDVPVSAPFLTVYNHGTWSIDLNQNGRWDGTAGGDGQITFGGASGDVPVEGIWGGLNCGATGYSAGVYNGGVWSLDYNCNGKWDGVGGGDRQFTFGGSAGDVPVVGSWSGSSQTCVGVFNHGVWSVDLNCNERWDTPSGGDAQYTFGSSGDVPLFGVNVH